MWLKIAPLDLLVIREPALPLIGMNVFMIVGLFGIV
tara:strand:- start:137 stop:244 length:108 start_codon:yes stop_codon:yes gene_type:complete